MAEPNNAAGSWTNIDVDNNIDQGNYFVVYPLISCYCKLLRRVLPTSMSDCVYDLYVSPL